MRHPCTPPHLAPGMQHPYYGAYPPPNQVVLARVGTVDVNFPVAAERLHGSWWAYVDGRPQIEAPVLCWRPWRGDIRAADQSRRKYEDLTAWLYRRLGGRS